MVTSISGPGPGATPPPDYSKSSAPPSLQTLLQEYDRLGGEQMSPRALGEFIMQHGKALIDDLKAAGPRGKKLAHELEQLLPPGGGHTLGWAIQNHKVGEWGELFRVAKPEQTLHIQQTVLFAMTSIQDGLA